MYQRVLPVFERILYTRLTSRSSFRRRLRVLLPQRVELARFPSFFTYDQKVHPSTSRPVIALPAREGELKGCSWPSTRTVPSGFTAARYSFPLKVTRSSFGIRSPRARSAGCRFPGSRSFFAAGAASRVFLCLAATFSVRAWPALSALQRPQTVLLGSVAWGMWYALSAMAILLISRSWPTSRPSGCSRRTPPLRTPPER